MRLQKSLFVALALGALALSSEAAGYGDEGPKPEIVAALADSSSNPSMLKILGTHFGDAAPLVSNSLRLGPDANQGTIALQATASFAAPAAVTVRCQGFTLRFSGQADNSVLSALKVGNIQ